MILNTQKVLTNFEGDALKDHDIELTLGTAIGNVLVVQKSPDPWRQYKLTNLIAKSEGEVELKAEDIVFIKKTLEENAKGDRPAYYPYIIGQCIDLLEETKDVTVSKKQK